MTLGRDFLAIRFVISFFKFIFYFNVFLGDNCLFHFSFQLVYVTLLIMLQYLIAYEFSFIDLEGEYIFYDVDWRFLNDQNNTTGFSMKTGRNMKS